MRVRTLVWPYVALALAGACAAAAEGCSTSASDASDASVSPAPTGTTPASDGSSPTGDSSASDSGVVPSDAGGSDSNASDSNASDANTTNLVGCMKLLAESPSTPSGVHTIDLDGNGPVPPLDLYCDMTFAGGGWTLLQAYTGTNTPTQLADASADSGFLVAAPRPGTFGALAGWVAQTLAAKSTQVHIRMSFAADAALADPDAGMWIMSRPLGDGGPTLALENLRSLRLLNSGSDGGIEDWIGPQATSQKLGSGPVNGCIGGPDGKPYPSIFWACANPSALGVVDVGVGKCNWTWSEASGHFDPIEIYVR